MRCTLCGHSSHQHMVKVSSPYCYDCGNDHKGLLYHLFSPAPLTWEFWPLAEESGLVS